MTSEIATKTAELISDDRSGADYYKDPDILAGFLNGQFGTSIEKATDVANIILQDRQGANYYKDSGILAELLDAQLGS